MHTRFRMIVFVIGNPYENAVRSKTEGADIEGYRRIL